MRVLFTLTMVAFPAIMLSGVVVEAGDIRTVPKTTGHSSTGTLRTDFNNNSMIFHGSGFSGGSGAINIYDAIRTRTPLIKSFFDAPSLSEEEIREIAAENRRLGTIHIGNDTTEGNGSGIQPIQFGKAYQKWLDDCSYCKELIANGNISFVAPGKKNGTLRPIPPLYDVYFPKWGNRLYTSWFFNIGQCRMSNQMVSGFAWESGCNISARLKKYGGIRECLTYGRVASSRLTGNFEWKRPVDGNDAAVARLITDSYSANSIRLITDIWYTPPAGTMGEFMLFSGVGAVNTRERTGGLLIQDITGYFSDYSNFSPDEFEFWAPVFSTGFAYNLPLRLLFTNFAVEFRYSISPNTNNKKIPAMSDNTALTHQIVFGLHLRI